MLPSGDWPVRAEHQQHCLSRPVSFRLFNPGRFRSSLASYSDLFMLKPLHQLPHVKAKLSPYHLWVYGLDEH
jgi:hypothetical protein